jgi:hypothetical protein
VQSQNPEVPSFKAPQIHLYKRMSLLESFLDPAYTSLKICGVTTREDATRLVAMGVDALGVNFWPKSKRYLAPGDATWLHSLHRIYR